MDSPPPRLIRCPAVRVGRATLAALLGACLAAPVAEAAIIGQGGVRMGADAMWSRGVLGQGQTVAVVDQGFAGLDRSIELGELPPRDQLQVRLFDPGGAEGGRDPDPHALPGAGHQRHPSRRIEHHRRTVRKRRVACRR